jgi:hypothetical protein
MGFINRTIPWERSAMPFWRRLGLTFRQVLLSPIQTFGDLGPGEPGPAIGFAALTTIPGTLIAGLHVMLAGAFEAVGMVMTSILSTMITVVIGCALSAGVVHLMFRLFGRAGRYSHLFRAFCYAEAFSVVIALLGLLPQLQLSFLGLTMVGGVFYKALAAYAVGRESYSLTKGKALAGLVLVGAAYVALAVVLLGGVALLG